MNASDVEKRKYELERKKIELEIEMEKIDYEMLELSRLCTKHIWKDTQWIPTHITNIPVNMHSFDPYYHNIYDSIPEVEYKCVRVCCKCGKEEFTYKKDSKGNPIFPSDEK